MEINPRALSETELDPSPAPPPLNTDRLDQSILSAKAVSPSSLPMVALAIRVPMCAAVKVLLTEGGSTQLTQN